MTTRYSRQEMIKGWRPEVIQNARVLVVGAGTTGNEVIKNLTLLGFGHITIIDYDDVEEVNLSRSVLFYEEDLGQPKAEVAMRRALALNRTLDIRGEKRDIIFDVGSQFYTQFDCVFLTVDNLEARMWVNRYCWRNHVPLINTGIEGTRGDFFLMLPPHTACIECSWKPWDYRRLAEKYSCMKLGLSTSEKKIPMVITSAAVIGGMAVQECVRYLHLRAENAPSLDPLTYLYMGEQNQSMLSWRRAPREDCPGHQMDVDTMRILPDPVDRGLKVEAVLEQLREALTTDRVEIRHDREIVYSVVCNNCGWKSAVAPHFLGKFHRSVCPNCHMLNVMPDDCSEQISGDFTLAELNIPARHLLKVLYLDETQEVREAWAETR